MSEEFVSERLASISVQLDFAKLPDSTRLAATLHWFDGLGVTVGGSVSAAGGVARNYLSEVAGDSSLKPLSPFAPSPMRTRADDDAFLLGTYAFSENYGDTSLRSVAHPNTVVIPAVLAAARARPVPGSKLLSAVVAGYQAMEFLARSLNNGEPRMGHQLRGFRPSASAGAVGAAITVAHAWDLPHDITKAAVEIACNYGGGLRRHGPGPTSSIRVHSGESARGGMTAVLLAANGLEGEGEMIEGSGGFLRAYMADSLDVGAEIYLNDSAWAVEDVAFKLHSTAHTLHTALDCILDLVRDGVRADKIEEIEILIPAQHATISASTPYSPPRTAAAAGGSYPYCGAVAAVTGDYVWPERLDAYLQDSEVELLADRTKVLIDDRQSDIFDTESGTWPATVTITDSGGSYRRERREPRGLLVDAELERDLTRKFVRLASRTLSETGAERLADKTMRIYEASDSYQFLSSAFEEER